MGNPVPQDDYKKRADIVCSLLAPIRNKLLEKQKAGDATSIITYGDKEVDNIQEHLVQEFMQASVKNYEVKIDDNALVTRIIDGKEVLVSDDVAKEIKQNIKLKTRKGIKIQEENEKTGR